MPLTEIQVKSVKPEAKTKRVTDEKGMYLEITPKGQKYWRLKYRFEGKEKRLAIGVYPETSLKQARQIRDDARSQLRNSIDPSAAKKAAKKTSQTDKQGTFESIARE